MTIKLNQIIPAPWNTRGSITPESVADLAKSIEEQGLINPITLWSHDSVVYCIAGNRRLEAIKTLGRSSLNDQEYTNFAGTEQEAKMVTVTENLQREDVGPIEEAALVAECLDAGMTAESIAAKTGRSTSWVNRRKKLIALDDCWKANTTLPIDALEKIAAYPAEVQKSVGKNFAETAKSWDHVKWSFERESHDLDVVKWDKNCCRQCVKRTGAEADLFGIADGKLGSCLDCKCYEAKRDAFVAAKVAEATKGATEVIKCSYYELPEKDESSARKTKKHPCAYVYVNCYDDVEVRWGESQKARKEREAERKAKEEAEIKARNEADAALRAVTDKLDGWSESGEGSPIGWDDLMRSMLKDPNTAAAEWVCNVINESITTWHSRRDWAELLRSFPEIAKLAGVTDAERDTLLDAYPESNDENETEN